MRALTLAAAALAGACSAAGPSDTIHFMQIEAVEVRIAESFPPQPFAHVRGIIPDGCSALDAVTQSRSGNGIEVLITVRRATDRPCIQVIEVFERSLRLEGTFGPGRYTVRVNGVAREFSI